MPALTRDSIDDATRRDAGRAGVVVCRGCCCGNVRKHPGTDHSAQLARLQLIARYRQVTVRTSECLGPCSQANVLVVRPSPGGRRRGGRAVWLALIHDLEVLELLDGWLTEGGPGLAPIPELLSLHVIDAPKPGL